MAQYKTPADSVSDDYVSRIDYEAMYKEVEEQEARASEAESALSEISEVVKKWNA